jgi:S-sulfo-L-cysteine synthase (3-phospho-L-serine-dependent)
MTPQARDRRVLLLIESNTSGTGYLFVQAARDLGCRPVLITARPEKYRYLSRPDAPDVVLVRDTSEPELAATIARRFARGTDVVGITSSSEAYVATAAALAARFGLPGPIPARLRAVRDKSWQRQMLAVGALPTPRFHIVTSVSSALAAARNVGFPAIVKPVDGTGSAGVRACTSLDEVEVHAIELFAAAATPHPRILVESLIDGPEYSVEAFSGRIIGITRKHLGSFPYFVETGHDYPAPIDTAAARTLVDNVTLASALFGLEWGPSHWELRLHQGRAYVIEVNPRLAGGFIPELVRHAHGIDLIRETLRLAIGERPDLAPTRWRHASLRFLCAPSNGRFVGADGVADAHDLAHIEDVALYCAPGDAVAIRHDFRDRLGHVIACADRPEDASAAAERARDTIWIRVDTRPERPAIRQASARAPEYGVA